MVDPALISRPPGTVEGGGDCTEIYTDSVKVFQTSCITGMPVLRQAEVEGRRSNFED